MKNHNLIFLILGAIVLISGTVIQFILEISRGDLIALALYVCGFLLLGKEILLNAIDSIRKKHFLNPHVIVLTASVAVFALGLWVEAVAVLLFFGLGELCSEILAARIKKRISSISKISYTSDEKPSIQIIFEKFAQYFTPAMLAATLVIALLPPVVFDESFVDWAQRGIIFMLISNTSVLVLMISVGFSGGVGMASFMDILVKGNGVLDALSSLDSIIFNKTGTLTHGNFEVEEIAPITDYTRDELLEMAACAQYFSNHAIAIAVKEAFNKPVNHDILTDFQEYPGYGVSVKIAGHALLAGNEKLMDAHNIYYEKYKNQGTKLYIALDDVFAGYIILTDKIRARLRGTMPALKQNGVRKTIMLTGDTRHLAEKYAAELSIDEVLASLEPEEKLEEIEIIKSEKPKSTINPRFVAFVGDENKHFDMMQAADIGIALGSDYAISKADVVIQTGDPSKILDVVKIARLTKQVIMQNIMLILGVKTIVMVLAVLGVLPPWAAVLADVLASLVAIANTARITFAAYSKS